MCVILVICLCFAAVAAVPHHPQLIIGGNEAIISQYPSIAALLYSWDLSTYRQACGGTIITDKAVLTAAHCPDGDAANKWRIRFGSTYANSGGYDLSLESFIIHPNYNRIVFDNDIAIMRTASNIIFVDNAVQPARIAGANYELADEEAVWAVGWGTTTVGGATSNHLRHVQIWTVNQETCAERYTNLGYNITENMLCSGWLDVGGRDQCQGDSGSPLYHNDILVGVCSWGYQCALAYYPGVNTRVSRFTTWVQANV